uniref:General transcription factor 3C polypeptide 5 n=1 Tax=Globodera rostochiensis TaxID=31243 RepID=A0A914HXL1_GLORO
MSSHSSEFPSSSAANQRVAEFVLIEYPGVVKNVQAALDTLGGVRAVSNTHFNNGQLELHFQPQNPFDSALSAERRNQSAVFSGQANLVLRIRRRKRRQTGEAMEDIKLGQILPGEANDGQMEIRCIGMVSTIYSFRNICDFQYLPLSNATTASAEGPVHFDLLSRIIPTDFTSALSWWNEQQQQLLQQKCRTTTEEDATTSGEDALASEVANFLPPYQFSRYNTPSKFILRDDVERWSFSGLRNERKALTITVNANDPFPEAPSEKALSDVELRCKNAELHQMLTELFTERPLWSRIGISYNTRLTEATLKIVLAKYAFYIGSGPWGRLWCRFGYDPRKDPWARCYQSIMVSFKHNQYIPERQRLKASSTASTGLLQPSQFFDYMYRPKVFPSLRQMWYCVCDVQLPIAQRICRKDFLETLKECDSTNGWLPAGRVDAIRTAIKKDVAKSSARIGEEEFEDIGSGISAGGGETASVVVRDEDAEDMMLLDELAMEEEELDEDESAETGEEDLPLLMAFGGT